MKGKLGLEFDEGMKNILKYVYYMYGMFYLYWIMKYIGRIYGYKFMKYVNKLIFEECKIIFLYYVKEVCYFFGEMCDFIIIGCELVYGYLGEILIWFRICEMVY